MIKNCKNCEFYHSVKEIKEEQNIHNVPDTDFKDIEGFCEEEEFKEIGDAELDLSEIKCNMWKQK